MRLSGDLERRVAPLKVSTEVEQHPARAYDARVDGTAPRPYPKQLPESDSSDCLTRRHCAAAPKVVCRTGRTEGKASHVKCVDHVAEPGDGSILSVSRSPTRSRHLGLRT